VTEPFEETDLPGEVTRLGAGTLLERLRRVRLLAMDVDGVLTDAGMYYSEHGDELKKFNTRDGQGIALARDLGVRTAILTGEDTELVARRAEKLRVDHLRQGVRDKRAALVEILTAEDVLPEQACYVGDDLNDMGALEIAGLAIVVNDAMRGPRKLAHYVTAARGGEGAIREVCELILDARRGSC
jgi:3-deoxy-D-manno-octulosonate 8-phosphate phosphatase (KDO 8-P phosphatase)